MSGDEFNTIRVPASLFGGPDAGAVLAAALVDIGRILTRQTRYGSLPIADAETLAYAEDVVRRPARWIPVGDVVGRVVKLDEARDLAREMLAEIDETPERVGTYIKRDEPAHKVGEPIMRYFLRIDPETYERWQGIADSW